MRSRLPALALLSLPLTAPGQDFREDLLPELEVTGRRAEDSRLGSRGRSSPIVIGPTVLRESAQPSVADLLRAEGGVNFTSFFGSPGTGVPRFRGFAGGASPRVLILVDGLPMTRPDLASPVWFEFPLAGLERVELQRGSRTVRYGSAALAGVISLETRDEVEAPSWHLQTSRGSWDTNLVRLHTLLPMENDWTVGAAGDFRESEGYRENSASDSRAFQLSLSSPRKRRWQWRATVAGSRTDLENPGGLGRSAYRQDPQQSIYSRFGIGEFYQNELTSLRTTQQILFRPHTQQLWQFNASWSGRQRELNLGAGSHTDHDLDSFAFELSHEWQHRSFSGSWGVRGASDFLFLSRFRDRDRKQRFATADLERQAVGAFVRSDWEFRKGWTLSGGVSWDTYDLKARARDTTSPLEPRLNFQGGTDDSARAAELSLDFQPDDTRRFWLRYDRSFRFPVLDEVAGYQGFLLEVPVNGDLGPESGHAFELGAEYGENRFKGALTGFSQSLDGEILFDPAQNLNRNFARSHRYGLESRLTYQGRGWRGLVNYAWTRARFRSGRHLGSTIPLVPRHQLSAQVQRKFTENLSLQLEWEWLSEAFEGGDFQNTRVKLPARRLVHLEGRYSFDEQWELYARLDNLLDERWASLKFLGQWYPGNGRSFTLGLRGQF